MEGKKREQKLILKEGRTIVPKDVINEIREILKDFSPMQPHEHPINVYYKDTYYDDAEASLYKSGGSLKVRQGVNEFGFNEKILVMRTKTQNPTKLKYSIFWDEMELPVRNQQKTSLQESIQPLKAIFTNFNFEKLKEEPVLICDTYRVLYKLEIIKDGEPVTISFLFDHIKYERDGKEAEDTLLKIRGRTVGRKLREYIYLGVLEKFPEYTLVESSRYERALEKLEES